MYVEVLVEIPIKKIDKCFIYKVAEELTNDIKIGIRVKVPFANRILEGFVLNIIEGEQSFDYKIKEIISIEDTEEILNEEMLQLGKDISSKTLCTLISAYQVMLPKALKAKNNTNMKIKFEKYLVLNNEKEALKYYEACPYLKQKELLEQIIANQKLFISNKTSTINTLLNKGIIKIVCEQKFRYQYNSNMLDKKITLTAKQQQVKEQICSKLNETKTFLFYGVTGSGKTEVYIEVIKEVLKQNKQAIMLVPEISLTPQIVGRFKQQFKDDIAVLHSGLSDAERYDEYCKIKQNLVKIVVGARSAVFAPFKNLGIIIIDEEHVSSYKQENHPRYHTRDIAILRSNYHKCPVILGSATPSLESFARCQKGVYELVCLKERIGVAKLPEISIVDMAKDLKDNNSRIFSKVLKEKIKEKLEKNEQIILFLNRRGYSSIITCANCGEVIKCPNCDISLTYHKTSNTLRCHYCGYGLPRPDECPKCQDKTLHDYGLGTQKVEEELHNIFPSARVVRMDFDTTSKKGDHQKIIELFSQHKYDILLGTQMIAKGLDFPLVTLVGVINADNSLNVADFRSGERTFQLLSQVSGRAGRSDKKGEVIIQTFNPNNYAITLTKENNYEKFYHEEMLIRKKLNYVPYYYITLVMINGKNYQECYNEAKKVSDYLRLNIKDAIILGPAMAGMFRVNNIFHFQCIIKYKNEENVMKHLKKLDDIYKLKNNVTIEIDVDPLKI